MKNNRTRNYVKNTNCNNPHEKNKLTTKQYLELLDKLLRVPIQTVPGEKGTEVLLSGLRKRSKKT